ncbi:L domain-like protein [Fomitiporia mediterranea MF3/22]|uniref:L domain-like protein n=1 Tax=Fomitiporia mediterranea (strain MF3/22) TaxID=694068 RepID=UPI0004409C3C|nr:L domain-like protein [Fomitiporia mediterranea MF3/22]EJD04395.1 L domain-like protein [Fomitiporia mediterranea MF3/22]
MKLTPELIGQSPSFLNPIKERQLDLRGHKIPAIENLGVTRDQHDAIDFTDNSIVALANFPLLRRLRTLLLANNRISSISSGLHLSVPNLTSLILTNNNITELGDLEPLRELKSLQYLSLMGNPVKEKKWYREWIIFRIPSLRVLDFQRIRDKERQAAQTLFVTPDGLLTALATTLSTTVSSNAPKAPVHVDELKAAAATAATTTTQQFKAGRLMTKEEAARVRAAIAAATNAEEIQKLERSLREGWIPNNPVGA